MEIVVVIVGVVGMGAALFFGYRLWQWERQLADARIAIAYKRKVKLEAPLVEWLRWAALLQKDEAANGRVVYRARDTSVAILKPRPKHGKSRTRTIKPSEQKRVANL